MAEGVDPSICPSRTYLAAAEPQQLPTLEVLAFAALLGPAIYQCLDAARMVGNSRHAERQTLGWHQSSLVHGNVGA